MYAKLFYRPFFLGQTFLQRECVPEHPLYALGFCLFDLFSVRLSLFLWTAKRLASRTTPLFLEELPVISGGVNSGCKNNFRGTTISGFIILHLNPQIQTFLAGIPTTMVNHGNAVNKAQ